MKDVLFLIPARSGSKVIINKNIKILGDYPLLVYRIKNAINLTSNKNIWISSDSEAYCNIASEYGVTIPFIRPKEIASDDSPSYEFILHAMNFAEVNNLKYQYICLLEPTSPFVYFQDIEKAYKKLVNTNNSDSIVATKEVHTNTFFIQEDSKYLNYLAKKFIKATNNLNRQNFPKEITPSGGFYISKWDEFKKHKSFYQENTLPFKLNEINGLEIDNHIDWVFAEFILEKKMIDLNKIGF